MRKALIFMIFVGLALADGRMFSIYGGWMEREDKGFEEVYGKDVWLGGAMLEWRVVGGIFLYGSYDSFKRKGKTLVFGEKAETTHQYFQMGLAKSFKLIKGFSMGLRVSGVYVNYLERSLGEEVNKNCLGFGVSGGLTYTINKFFLRGRAEYIYAKNKVLDKEVTLGGLRLLAAAGIIF